MALTQKRVDIARNMLVDLYLVSNGSVMLQPGYGFVPLYDDFPTGVSGTFDAKGFSLDANDGKGPQEYNWLTCYPYKQMPVLKAWLVQQDMEWPN